MNIEATVSAVLGFLLLMGVVAIILLAITIVIVFLIQQLVRMTSE
jgi:uncharacterized membrane protein